jgi:hypothetical protein
MAAVVLAGLTYCIFVFSRSTDSNKWMHLIILLVVIAYCASQFQEFVNSNDALDTKITELTLSYEQEEIRQKELTRIKQQ